MEENSFMASHDQDKPAADLLRRSLASSPGVEQACPDPEILAAYSERSLDADETVRFELHFSRCARCREQLAALGRAGELVGAAEEKRPRTQHVPWIWNWRWLAPAAAAFVFLALLIALRPVHHPAEESLVAMDHQPAPPAAPASAPHSSFAGGSPARTSPPLNSAKSDVAPPVASRELPETRGDRATTSPPLKGRTYTELMKPEKPPVVSGANPSAAGSSSRSGGTSQAVTSTAASPPAAQAARVPADMVPPDVATAGPAFAGAVGAPQTTEDKKMSVMVRDRSLAQTESVMVEAGELTSARTLVRTPDPEVLWRFSSGRFVERSSDAGATWRVQWTNAGAHLIAGAAPTADTCWLVGRDAMILLTTDGRKWKTISPPADADFVDIAATDASSATVTTTDDRKFRTSDGGKHWTPAP
jgi:hypothetical protein